MSPTKKPSKLSADERAFLDRIHSLNEEETGKLTFEELNAYWNIMHKIDPRSDADEVITATRAHNCCGA
jgi:hypothetical protein